MTNTADFKLRQGDAVTIIAPASHLRHQNKHMLALGQAILEDWGLDVVSLCAAGTPHHYLAADDNHRARELNLALSDPEVKAIFSIRGGYGCARLLSMIQYDADIQAKIFCGFSDLTTLLLAFDKTIPAIINIHGPHIATAQFTDNCPQSALTRASLKEALFEPGKPRHETISVIRPGKAQGRLIGGSLSLITALLGTPYQADFNHSILFIEDVGEKPYRIDRMITQLRLAGVFDAVKGVVIGDFENCVSPNIDLETIIRELFSFAKFPVISGLRAGHGQTNLAMRIGQNAVIDTDIGEFVLN